MRGEIDEARVFRRNKWVYSLGGIGRDMAYTLFATYLLSYVLYTREITAPQFAAIGVILTVCRLWDGLNDPVMGGIIENTRTRYGKFKPYILIGAATNAVVLIVLFSMRLQGWAFVAAFAVLYLLWDITYTMNDIGYWSMLPSLAKDPARRNSISSMANLFAAIGAIAATGLIPVFTNGSAAIGGNAIVGYAVIAAVIACVFFLCQLMTCLGVRESHVASAPLEERIGLKKMVRVIVKNDQLLWVTLIMLLYNLGSALLTAFGVNYIYLSFGYNGFYVTLFSASYAVASVLVNALYPRLASWRSRRYLASVALGLTVLGYLMFFASGSLLPLSIGMLCVDVFVIAFGQSLFYMVITICLANTIEYNEVRTGKRDEAIVFALRPFMAKMSSALQQVILTLVYLIIGMTFITNGISNIENQVNLGQMAEAEKATAIEAVLATAPDSVAFALRCWIVFLPIALIGLAYLLLRAKYTIDEKEYARILAVIKEREEASA